MKNTYVTTNAACLCCKIIQKVDRRVGSHPTNCRKFLDQKVCPEQAYFEKTLKK